MKIGLFAIVLAFALMFTSCSKESKDETVEQLNDFAEDVTQDKEPEVFPKGMTNGGYEFYGDGRTDDEEDLLTAIENWIWKDDAE